MINFDFFFLENDLAIVSSPHFVYDVWRKMLSMLYFINWLNVIVWLSLLFDTLDNKCIIIVCFPSCDVIRFEINLFIKPFSRWSKFQSESLNIYRMKRALKIFLK